MGIVDCHVKLLVDIVYHAVRDSQIISGEHPTVSSRNGYADDDHETICCGLNYTDGKSELLDFFGGEWFDRICDEFVDISASDIRDYIEELLAEDEMGSHCVDTVSFG